MQIIITIIPSRRTPNRIHSAGKNPIPPPIKLHKRALQCTKVLCINLLLTSICTSGTEITRLNFSISHFLIVKEKRKTKNLNGAVGNNRRNSFN